MTKDKSILIKNIFYMLSYAFNVLNENGYSEIKSEKFDNIHNLFAAVISKGVAIQIKRGLGKEYINKTKPLRSPKGKINISESLQQSMIQKKQLVCDYDEYSDNTCLNQIIKTTMFLLVRTNEVDKKYKKELKRNLLYFNLVDTVSIKELPWLKVRYNRNNATYRMLINICYLVVKELLLTTEKGNIKVKNLLDDQNMHKLYEKFVLEYYKKHYPKFKVSASQIKWNVDDGYIEFLPKMQTDITIQYKEKIIIIDTKYYTKTMQTHSMYDTRTMHSHNLYQILTYVKNKDINHTGNVSGVLLYAKTDEVVTPNHDYSIDGNRISVKTLDLNKYFDDICEQLDGIIKNV